MRSGTSIIATPVAVLIIALSGCAAPQPDNPAPSGSADDAVLTPAAADLVVRAEPFRVDQWRLLRAELELTRRCLKARGLDYPTPSGGVNTDDDEWRPNLDVRRVHGYGLSAAVSDPAQPAADPATAQPGYEQALFGEPGRTATLSLRSGPRFTFPTTGCIAQSRSELYGDVMDAARVSYWPQEAYNAVRPHIETDPAMRAAIERWAQCMRDHGHPFSTMTQARDAVAERYKASGASTDNRRFEVGVAVDDAGCARDAGIPSVVDQVGRRWADRLPPEQRRDLNRATRLRTAALARATRLIPSSP